MNYLGCPAGDRGNTGYTGNVPFNGINIGNFKPFGTGPGSSRTTEALSGIDINQVAAKA
jgi:hypothetical protein